MNIIKLSVNVFNRVCRRIRGLPQFKQYPFTSKLGIKLTHISAFGYGNAGDLYLPIILRNLFNNSLLVKKWNSENVHKVVTSKDVEKYNDSQLIIIGGGGLFLTDTNPNDLSGWQWSCSLHELKDITSPIVLFAVGYNRFRGQEEFKPIFTQHLNLLVEKAKFVGIRNRGSIEKLKNYLNTEELKKKLVFQPCMTTLTSLIYPTLCNYAQKENFIAINCAFDRQELRSNNVPILKSIARVAQKLSKMAKIKFYSHMNTDQQILPYFNELGLQYELVTLDSIDKIVKEYAKPRLVIGMRGHAQMIPFGCNTPILSIISHDKMQWFLDDIQHPDWGVDVLNLQFEEELLIKAQKMYMSTNELIPILKKEQTYLYEITLKNMEYIKSLIK